MDWICEVLRISKEENNPGTTVSYPLTTPEIEIQSITEGLSGAKNVTLKQTHLDPWDFHDWNKNVFIPALCAFGLIGNVLNLVILGKRIREGRQYV